MNFSIFFRLKADSWGSFHIDEHHGAWLVTWSPIVCFSQQPVSGAEQLAWLHNTGPPHSRVRPKPCIVQMFPQFFTFQQNTAHIFLNSWLGMCFQYVDLNGLWIIFLTRMNLRAQEQELGLHLSLYRHTSTSDTTEILQYVMYNRCLDTDMGHLLLHPYGVLRAEAKPSAISWPWWMMTAHGH
jgi:hypothetical protein